MKLHLRWDTRPLRWFTNRLPVHDTHRLTIHNVYVLPSRAGWMMLVTIVALLLATINYQLSLGYVLIFLLMGAGVVGLFLVLRALTRMQFTLATTHELRGKAGDDFDLLIEQIHQTPQGTQRTERQLSLKLGAAGVQAIPSVIIETRYPLGLFRLWTVWRIASTIQVDEPNPAQAAGTHSQWTFSAQALMQPRSASIKTDIRAFKMGDTPRDLLWKTVAKRPDTPSSWGVRDFSDAADEPQSAAVRRTQPPPPARDAAAQTTRQLAALARLRDLTLLFALFLIALPFFQHLMWWFALFAVSLIGWRFRQIQTGEVTSRQWLQLPLLLALGLMVWLTFRSFSGIEAGVSACIGLLGIKALELPDSARAADVSLDFSRHHWVIIFLGLFTLSAHFLMSQSIASSVQVVLGLTALLYVLVMSHSTLQNQVVASKPSRLVLSQPLKTTLVLVTFGTPLMLVMFFLFPRFAPLWSVQEQKLVAQSGLSSEMRIGDIGSISQDSRIVLRLQTDEPPPLTSAEVYLRSYVLPRFDGRTWFVYRPRTAETAKPKLLLDAPQLAGRGYTLTPEGEKPYHAAIEQDIRDDMDSISPAYLQITTELPAGSNPRTRQWLQGLKQEAQFQTFTDTDWSNYLLGLLRTGGYRYTLSPGDYGKNVIDEILFDRKLGFCEHYAAAYVVAMRSLGIPARVVTGYQGAETNPIDHLQVVRNSNAHAWAEYWGQHPGSVRFGWLRVDPTAQVAPARIQNAEGYNQAPQQLAQQGRGLWGNALLAPLFKTLWRARQGWEATNHAWEEWFENYNQTAQMSWLKSLGMSNPSWQNLLILLDVCIMLLLGIGVVWYVWHGLQGTDKWLALMEAFRAEAVRRGIDLPRNATPRELSPHMATAMPQQAAQINQWLLDLEATRYAPTQSQRSLAKLKLQLASLFATHN